MTFFKSHLFILFLVVFTELIGFGLIIPVLPQIAAQYELNHFMLGILMSAFSFAQFFSAPLLGHWSDKFGRRPLLIVSKLGTVLAYIILAYANSFWLFLIARLLDGFTGGNIAVARAYIADVTPVKDRAKGMAVIGISFGLGFIFGPALGGVFYTLPNGQFVASLVASGLSFIAVLFTYFLLKEPENKVAVKEGFTLIRSVFSIKQGVLLAICFIYFIYMISFSGFETTFSVFTHYIFDLSIRDNSLLFMYAGIIGLIVQLFLSKNASANFVLFIMGGFFCLAFGFLGMAHLSTVVSLILVLSIFSIGISLVNTFMPALLSAYTTDGNRGLVMGVYESIGSVSRIIGPLVAYSIAISYIRYEYIVYGVFMLLLIPFIYYFCWYRRS
tara:strand:+ start:14574 stop:15731 length:1158 start_codon:yes stop_codon:yes gene_type:complete